MRNAQPAKPVVKTLPVRMKPEVHEQLANVAASDGRSMSSYVLRLIETDIASKRRGTTIKAKA